MTPHGDRGLQPERTSLARVRTLLSLVAVAVLCVRCAVATGESIRIVVVLAGALAFAVASLVAVPGQHRRACTAFADEHAAPGTGRALALVLAVLALAIASVIAVVAG